MPCPVCMLCGNCGKEVPFKKKLEKGTCLLCGFENRPDATSCARCGAVLPLPPGVSSKEES